MKNLQLRSSYGGRLYSFHSWSGTQRAPHLITATQLWTDCPNKHKIRKRNRKHEFLKSNIKTVIIYKWYVWGCRIVRCILTSRYLVSLLPVSIIHVSDIFLVGFWSWEISFIMWGCWGWGWQGAGTWVSVSR